MSDYIGKYIEEDWDEIAIDDGSIVSEKNNYFAKVFDRQGNEFESVVDSIRFTEEINSAPEIDVDIEAKKDFQNVDILDGVLEVFVDGDILFAGIIKKVSFGQTEDDFYTVTAVSPGMLMRDKTASEVVDEEITIDYLAKLVDRYDGVVSSFNDRAGTSAETLTNVDTLANRVYHLFDASSVAEHQVTLTNPSDLSYLYVKISQDVDVTIEGLNNGNTHTESFSIRVTDAPYGDWKKMDTSQFPDDSQGFFIKFTTPLFGRVFDWVAGTSERDLDRIVDVWNPETLLSNHTIETVSGSDWENVILSKEEAADEDDVQGTLAGKPFTVENNQFENLQSCYTTDVSFDGSGGVQRQSDSTYESYLDTASGGEYRVIYLDTQTVTFTFTPKYDIPGEHLGFSFRTLNEYAGGMTNNVTINVNGTGINGPYFWDLPGSNFATSSWEWNHFSDMGSYGPEPPDSYPAGQSVTVQITLPNNHGGDNDSEGLAIDIVAPNDRRYDYNFDNTLDNTTGNSASRPKNYLDGPELYPKSVDFAPAASIAPYNLTEATVDATVNGWRDKEFLRVRFDDISPWRPKGNFIDDSIINWDNQSYSLFLQPLFRTNGLGVDRTSTPNITPRNGYKQMVISDYTVTADVDDLPVTNGDDASGTLLAVMSEFADDSNIIFRWEGNTCRLFKQGSRTISKDLITKDVSSSVDIQETYSSVEVIGKGGVSSGVVDLQRAPSWLDRKRENRDRDVTTEEQASEKAKSFLLDNSEINYSGNIQTLPTTVPVGEELPASLFTHGQSNVVKSASYSKTGTDISAGREETFGIELLNIRRAEDSSQVLDTK